MTAKPVNASPAWLKLLGLFTVSSLIETMFYSQLLAFTPLYLPQFGIGEEEILVLVGTITAISNGVGIPFLPLWGALADRYSRKPIIIRSFFVLLMAGLIGYLAQSVWVFVLARSITSFALGNSGLMMTTLSERLPPNRIGLSFSIMNSAAPIGAFLGPLVGGRIVDLTGFRSLLLIDVFVLLLVVLGLSLGYKETFKGTGQEPILQMAWESLKLISNSRRLRALFPALFLLYGGWMLTFTYLPLVITTLYSGPDEGTIVGIVIGASGLTTLILSPILGALSDKYGSWRMLFISSFLALLLWPTPTFTRDLVQFAVIWSVLNGLVSASFAISFSVLSASAEKSIRGRVMSFAYMPVNIGFMIGPAIGTRLTQVSLFAIFPASAIFTALGLGALYFAYRQPSPPENEVR